MPDPAKNTAFLLKALRQLGLRQLWHYAHYQFRLRTGILRWKTRPVPYSRAAADAGELQIPLFPLPDPEQYRSLATPNREQILTEADEILEGQVRLFGGRLRPLRLTLDTPLDHWTRHTSSQHNGEDIKLIWEPARFGWAAVLYRAWLLTGDPAYPEAFWQRLEEFTEANPPNLGPHWASAQEVALRLMAAAFAAGVFRDADATTPARLDLLKGLAASHADRIAATLDYARAQNNNHLLSEAAGLYTATALLPGHPRAGKWRDLGWRWFHRGVQSQIDSDGGYVQHSTNYLRLVLQLALYVKRIAEARGDDFPTGSADRLAAAANWLTTLMDADSGRIPNLGGNDGAYFLPLTSYPYADFRPVLLTARQAFIEPTHQPEEMTLWLGSSPPEAKPELPAPFVLRLEGQSSWAYLRAARFSSRPAHADQLHLDLWWRGMNITIDPGVYQYNAAPPWRNPLDDSAVHNTLTLNSQPQMTKAGQFLWLDWAQARLLDTSRDDRGRLTWTVAEHNGYRHLGILHRRTVSVEGDRWMVRDQVWPHGKSTRSAAAVAIRLHWLLPDWPFEFNNGILRLNHPDGEITMRIRFQEGEPEYSLVRAGERVFGDQPADPVRGWFSPTYAEKIPALSLAVTVQAAPPQTITTLIELPD
jgi:hypothetical protein